MTDNQNPEQKARDNIDALLAQAGWSVQSNKTIDFNVGAGQAIREYQTDVGPADYVLFVDKKAVGVIEAKREDLGQNLTAVEQQTEGYELDSILLTGKLLIFYQLVRRLHETYTTSFIYRRI